MKPIAILVLLVMISVSARATEMIGLFSDPTCSSSHLAIGPGEVGTFQVRYVGDTDPIGGVEFRIVGLPADWGVLSVVPNPFANLVLGNPLGIGTDISFPTGPPGSCVHLFTIQVVAPSVVNDVMLQVLGRDPPSNPVFPCPFAVFDCGACDRQGCVAGGQLFISSTVGIEPATWSTVERLYR